MHTNLIIYYVHIIGASKTNNCNWESQLWPQQWLYDRIRDFLVLLVRLRTSSEKRETLTKIETLTNFRRTSWNLLETGDIFTMCNIFWNTLNAFFYPSFIPSFRNFFDIIMFIKIMIAIKFSIEKLKLKQRVIRSS